MNKLTFSFIAAILMSTFSWAQTWVQLPYYYQQGGTPKVFASPGDTLIAGSGYLENRISVSTDGGNNWQEIHAAKPVIAAEFGPDGEMYMLTSKRYMTTSTFYPDTLYRSSSASAWSVVGKIQDVSAARDEGDYTISADNTLCFPYKMNYSAGEPYLSKSIDNGTTWTNPGYSGDMTSIACSPTADTIVIGTSGNGVRYSHDGGVTFNSATGGNWSFSVVGGMAWLPNGDVYAAGPGQVYKSTDGGITFTNLSPNPWMPIVINEFIYSNGMFYIWGPNGVCQSPDCIAWTVITGNLPDLLEMTDMAVSNGYLYAVTDTNLYSMALSTGIESQQQSLLSVQLFPNPSAGVFTVRSTEGIVSITITDMTGRIVEVIPVNGSATEVCVNAVFAEAGTYIVIVEGQPGRRGVQRLIVE